MYRITNLFRVNIKNAFLIILFYLKRVSKIRTNEKEEGLIEFYLHLINSNGKQIYQTVETYSSFFKDYKMKVRFRKRPSSDLEVFNQIFIKNEYRPVVDIYKEYFNANSPKIIDAGANIGLATLFLNTQFDSPCFILLEPDLNNFEILSYNLKSNLINAIAEKSGLWSKETNLKIVNNFRDKRDWSLRVEETDEKGINAITVDYIITKYDWDFIDILKIDIEGSEKEVFTSINADVSFLSKTKCIAIEIHDEFNCRENIYKILEDFSFVFFKSGELTIGVNSKLFDLKPLATIN